MATVVRKRVYEPAEEKDGYRVLVDRLWPRGLSRDEARLDLWLKEVAPSSELRKWFHHDTSRWTEFGERYREELGRNPALDELREVVAKHRGVTLLYGSRDEAHNHAVIIQELLAS